MKKMTNLEIRFLETVPSRISELVKELKEINLSLGRLEKLLEVELKKEEE